MNYAFTNGKILDGTKDMQVQTGLCILVQDGTITDIVPDTADLAGYKTIDLQGRYIMPGLINMHVHLAGNGKPQKNSATMKTRKEDNAFFPDTCHRLQDGFRLCEG